MADRATRGRLSLLIDGTTVILMVVAIGLLLDRPANGVAREREAPDRIEALQVRGTMGAATLLGSADEPDRLLLIFRSDCPACNWQKDSWHTLAAMARARGIDVVALTPEPLTDSVRAVAVAAGATSVFTVGTSAMQALATPAVPATILVAGDGRVRFHGIGVLEEGRRQRLQKLLDR